MIVVKNGSSGYFFAPPEKKVLLDAPAHTHTHTDGASLRLEKVLQIDKGPKAPETTRNTAPKGIKNARK